MLFVYVIVVVPTESAVTNPVVDIVATVVFDESHGFVKAGGAEPDNCDVVLTHALNVPVSVGRGLTVKVAVTWHPFEFV